ncbi:hypothetical protein [Pseudomonas sp. ML2-2023-3]|uniref:hypothetical protein n=1 Tax=Pseudomonas sp. ML2-2023-3 TaxID=3122375 RepID=UPI0030D35AE4
MLNPCDPAISRVNDHVDTTRLSEFGGVGVVEQLSVQHQQVTAEPKPILIPHCR